MTFNAEEMSVIKSCIREELDRSLLNFRICELERAVGINNGNSIYSWGISSIRDRVLELEGKVISLHATATGPQGVPGPPGPVGLTGPKGESGIDALIKPEWVQQWLSDTLELKVTMGSEDNRIETQVGLYVKGIKEPISVDEDYTRI